MSEASHEDRRNKEEGLAKLMKSPAAKNFGKEFVASDKARSAHEKCVEEIQADSLMTKYAETGTLTNSLTALKDEAAIMNVAEVKHVEFAVMQAAYCKVLPNQSKILLKNAAMI